MGEDWMRAATAGRAITLLRVAEVPDGQGRTLEVDGDVPAFERIPALYHLDRSLTKFSVLPTARGDEKSSIVIAIDSIQVICPAAEYTLFCEKVQSRLDDAEN